MNALKYPERRGVMKTVIPYYTHVWVIWASLRFFRGCCGTLCDGSAVLRNGQAHLNYKDYVTRLLQKKVLFFTPMFVCL